MQYRQLILELQIFCFASLGPCKTYKSNLLLQKKFKRNQIICIQTPVCCKIEKAGMSRKVAEEADFKKKKEERAHAC